MADKVFVNNGRIVTDAFADSRKNIFIEGLQGMGKSTLLKTLSEKLPKYQVYREGDLSPAELAWCSCMTEQEYLYILKKYPDIAEEIKKWTNRENEYYVVAYTRILTDYEGFHRELEKYEIYNGRKSFEEFKRIIHNRFKRFNTEEKTGIEGNCGNIFECSFFQNIIEDLILFHMLSDDEIIEFYKELYRLADKASFLVLYLDSDYVSENITKIKEERTDESGNRIWYKLMYEYFRESPYGKKHNVNSFDDLINHFRHRQRLERCIINEVLGDNAIVLPAKKWSFD